MTTRKSFFEKKIKLMLTRNWFESHDLSIEISYTVLVPSLTQVSIWLRNTRLFLQLPPRLNSWSWTFMWHIQFRRCSRYASRIYFGALKLASSLNSFEFWSVASHVTSLLFSNSQYWLFNVLEPRILLTYIIVKATSCYILRSIIVARYIQVWSSHI